jgi:hypothetical protein
LAQRGRTEFTEKKLHARNRGISENKSIVLRSQSCDPEACIIDWSQSKNDYASFCLEKGDSRFEGLTFQSAPLVAHPFGIVYSGGAFKITNGAPVFTNCIFKNNHCDQGGAIAVFGSESHPLFVSCQFISNGSAFYSGGAVYIEDSAATFQGCRFADNHSNEHGGAAYILNSEVDFSGCLFQDNYGGTEYEGAAIFFDSTTSSTITNCTFWGNWVHNCPYAGTISVWNGSNVDLNNSILFANGCADASSQSQEDNLNASCCCIGFNLGGTFAGPLDGQQGVNGNISSGELFCSYSGDNFYLAEDSLCSPENNQECGQIGAFPAIANCQQNTNAIQWAPSIGGNGHWYEIVSNELPFFEAQEWAQNRSLNGFSGHLATFSSPEEHAFVMQFVPTNSATKFGLHQFDGSHEPDGGWNWVNGEQVSYSNWYPGEPNNSSSGEKIAMTGTFGTGHQWNDMPDVATPFIVEYGPTNSGVWYVGLDGSDSYTGTVDSPFATLSHAIAMAADGDTIFVFPGEYSGPGFEEILVEGKGVVVSGYDDNDKPVLNISEGQTGITFLGSWNYEGQTPAIRSIVFQGGSQVCLLDFQSISISNCEFIGCTRGVSQVWDQWGYGNGVSGHFQSCQFSNFGTGIKLDHFEAIDCDFENGGTGLSVWVDSGIGGQVSNCSFSNVGTGIVSSNAYSTLPSSVVISNSQFFDVDCVGFGSFSVNDSHISGGGGFQFCEWLSGVEISVNNCVIDSCAFVFNMDEQDYATVYVHDSTIKNCDSVANFRGRTTEFDSGLYIFNSSIFCNHGGITLHAGNLHFEMRESFYSWNMGGISCSDPYNFSFVLENNTFVANDCKLLILDHIHGSPVIKKNIFAYGASQVLSYTDIGTHDRITVSDNLFFKNFIGSDINGEDPVGVSGNIHADPMFCRLDLPLPTLAAGSICLPENHPSGILIGATEMGCTESQELNSIYVSPLPDQFGMGASPDTPLPKIDLAMFFLEPGGQINFLDGLYEDHIHVTKPLTLKSHSGDPLPSALSPHGLPAPHHHGCRRHRPRRGPHSQRRNSGPE